MTTATRTRRLVAVGAVFSSLAFAACGDDAETEAEQVADSLEEVVDEAAEDAEDVGADVAEALRDNGLESVASAVERVDFSELTDSREFTFFAPDDEAFQALEAEQVADLLSDPERLTEVLRNHVVDRKVSADELRTATSIDTEAGNTLDVAVADDRPTVGVATVVTADIEVSNGVVHVVDRLLLP